MKMWYIILTVLCISLYLLFRAYIKISFRFWSRQPVFHWYDFHYHFTDSQRIESTPPPIDEYVNLFDIETTEMGRVPADELGAFFEENGGYGIDPIGGENHPSFLSTYRQQGIIYGAITARPLYLRLKGQREFPLYYADHLCVHRGMRKKGIARQLIRTHYYQTRRLRPEISVSLFKRAGASNSMIPLVTYQCVTLAAGALLRRQFPHASNTLIEINKDKMALLFEFVRLQNIRFECVILPDWAVVAHRIENEIWHIYGIIEADRLKAAYVFHRSGLLLASIDACEFVELFQIGFEQACLRFANAIAVNQIAVNQIGDSLRLRLPIQRFRTESLYLYNYIAPGQSVNKCLIMN